MDSFYMTSKQQAQEKIEQLIAKYEQVVRSDRVKKYTEEETKKDFILPLFEALGWDVTNSEEVSAEEHIKSSGRVDYGFYLNGYPKFFVEAKPLKADLHKEEFARQAIRYSWNKGVTWAVLTDFQGLKIFNAQDAKSSLANKQLFSIPYNEYIQRIDQLWLLSREVFEKNLLDAYAEKIGKKFERVPVGDSLYKDLNECRTILTNSLGRWNTKVDKDLLDEGIQRLLDRLIFIRVAEDRGIEPPTLFPLLRAWDASKDRNETPLYKSMVNKFRELDKVYDSNLFTPHPFENWEEYDGSTEKIVNILYGKPGYYEYDFKVIPADVLGAVYENYLGYKLVASKKGSRVGKDSKKRKEQGIYYTPRFIVDYVVKNALQPVLDSCESVDDLKKIKVLDPACGSGSFLIKAMDAINEKYKEFGYKGDELTKLMILSSNLYGVDLDPQAVELARLNLLLNALDARGKLPDLTKNIKNGNSLISGTDEELKKYFGENFRDKKPFNWGEEFPDVFKQGGFDVVIGNPPYIDSEEMVRSQPEFRKYCLGHYRVAKGNWDLFCIFIERGLSLMKTGGRVGMIVPNKLISAEYSAETRDLLRSNSIVALADYSTISVFGASVYPIVIIVKKGRDESNKFIIVLNKGEDFPQETTEREFSRTVLQEYKNSWAPLFAVDNDFDFLDKIIKKFPRLDELKNFDVSGAATVGEAYEIKKFIFEKSSETDNGFKLINTGTIDRYSSLWGIQKTRYLKDSYEKPIVDDVRLKEIFPKRFTQSSSEKIIIAGMTKFLECCLDENHEFIAGKSTTIVVAQSLHDLKILLAILNSSLMSSIYARLFKSLSLAGGFFRIGSPQIKSLPIHLPKGKEADALIEMVNNVLVLSKERNGEEKNSDKWNKVCDEIKRLEKNIDAQVYKLYDLTPEEIKIIETIE